jgi:hypothetical protein
VDLLDTPQDIPFLSGLIQREIIYGVLQGAEGARLRAIATHGEQSIAAPKRAPAALVNPFVAAPKRIEKFARDRLQQGSIVRLL